MSSVISRIACAVLIWPAITIVAQQASAQSVTYGTAEFQTTGGHRYVNWTTTAQSGIADFHVLRSTNYAGAPILVGSTVARSDKTYSIEDTTSLAVDSYPTYWVVARTAAGVAAKALGPLGYSVPGATIEQCPLNSYSQCIASGYFSTICGQFEYFYRGSDVNWVCAPIVENAIGDYIQNESRPNWTLVKPKTYLSASGTPTQTFLETTAGNKVLVDAQTNQERSEWFQGALTWPVPSQTEAAQTDANGAAVATCREFAYQATEGYSNWADALKWGTFSKTEAVQSLFSGSTAMTSVSAGVVTFVARDSDNVPLATTSGSLSLFPSVPLVRSALDLWDATNHRPAPSPPLVVENWQSHYDALQRMQQYGWSEDELEALRQESLVLARLVARHAQLEFEAMRTILEDEVRYSHVEPNQAWRLVNERIHNLGRSDNHHAIACRWTAQQNLGARAMALGASSHVWFRDTEHLEHGPPTPGYQEQEALPILPAGDFGTEGDPMAGMSGAPPPPPSRTPGDLDGDFGAGPPPQDGCGVGDPVSPLIEPALTPTTYPLHDPFMDWRLGRIQSAQQMIVAQIEEQKSRLAPLCSPIEKCMWAPSVLLNRVNSFYQALQAKSDNTCREDTDGNLVNLSRLFGVVSLVNFTSAEKSQIQAMQTTDYAQSVSTMRQLDPDLEAFRQMNILASIRGLKKIARQNYKALPKNGDNRAVSVVSNGSERSRSSRYASAAIRLEQMAALDCAIDPLNLPSPRMLYKSVCNCLHTELENIDVQGAILTSAGSAAPILETFFDLTSDAAYTGSAGLTDATLLGGLQVMVTKTPISFILRVSMEGVPVPVILGLIGPIPVHARSGQAGSFYAELSRPKLSGALTDICNEPEGFKAFEGGGRVSSGVDAFVAVGVGMPFLVEYGVEGRIEVFHIGGGIDVDARIAQISPEEICPNGVFNNGVCAEPGFETYTDLQNFLVHEIGCDEATVNGVFNGTIRDPDAIQAACQAVLLDPRHVQDALDKIVRIKINARATIDFTFLGGSVSAYVYAVLLKFSVQLFDWPSIRLQSEGAIDTSDLVSTGRSLCHESIAVFPPGTDQAECWPEPSQ